MTNWQIARYLIDAKKEVDALWFIAAHVNDINGNIKRLVELHRNTFYINAVVVVDKFVDSQGLDYKDSKQYKRDLRDNYILIEMLYQYRHKHAAHKDETFRDTQFTTLMQIVNEAMQILHEVRKICASVLPQDITLNFVCYDAELFRALYCIAKEDEERILNLKHPLRNVQLHLENPITKKVFYDTEDLWKVQNAGDYCTVLHDGLTLYERLQHMQDWSITTNVLYGYDIWVTPNEQAVRACLMMTKLGYLDIFMRPRLPLKEPSEYANDLSLIKNAEKYLVYDLHVSDKAIQAAIDYSPSIQEKSYV